jgi:DinB superfamily
VTRPVLAHAPYLAEHTAAVKDFTRAVEQLDSATWFKALGPDKWSPALVTEHVTLSIEAFTDDAAGRAHMAVRTNAWRRFVLRTLFLRRLLKEGTFPPGVRAPRETRPSPTPRAQREAIEYLQRAAGILEATLAAHPAPERCQITHPFFGPLPLITSLRLLTLHTRHHLAQLPALRHSESST